MEGSQSRRGDAQRHLPGARTPSRHKGSGGLRRRLPGDQSEQRRDWQHVVPFFAYPSVRSIIIYPTNTVECRRRVGAISNRLILVSQLAASRGTECLGKQWFSP